MDRQYYKGTRSVLNSYSQSNPTETNSSSLIGQRANNYRKVEYFSSTPPYNSKSQKGNDRISEDEHLKSLECSSVYGNNESGSYEMSWIYGLVNNIDKNSSSQSKVESKLESKVKQRENASNYPVHHEQNKIISPILQNKPKIDQFSKNHRQTKHRLQSALNSSEITRTNHPKYTYSQTNTNAQPLLQKYDNYRDRTTRQIDCQHNTKFHIYQKQQHHRVSHYQKQRDSKNDPCEPNKLWAKEYEKKGRSTTVGANSRKRYSYCCLEGKQQFNVRKEYKDNAINDYKYTDVKEEYKDKFKTDCGINQNDSIGRIKRRNLENTQKNYSLKYAGYKHEQSSQQQRMLLEKYAKPRQIESYGYTRKYVTKQQQPQQEQQVKINEMAQKLNKVLQNINHKSTIIRDSKPIAKENYDLKIRSMSYCEKSDKTLSIYDPTNHQKCSPNPVSIEKGKETRVWEKDGTSDNKSKYGFEQQGSSEHRKYSKYHQQYAISDFDQKQHHRGGEGGKPTKSKNQHSKQKKKKQKLIQSMKKSIGKHLPNEIIIEQSSSQFGSSQFSEEPRCHSKSTFRSDALRYHQNKTQQDEEDYTKIQQSFMKLFDSLDKAKLGYLNQRNYDTSKITSELKYLFGGILTSIRYNPQKVYMKDFLKQCQGLWADLGITQKDQLLKMIENMTSSSNKQNGHSRYSSNSSLDKNQFKINIKDIKREKSSYYCPRIIIREVDDSHVIPTHNNRDHASEVQYYESKSSQSSKRSSQFSEVVKKYEFNSESEFTPREHENNAANKNSKGKELLEPTYSQSKELSAHQKNRSNRRNFSELYDNLNKKLNKYISTVTTTSKGQQINSCASMGNSHITQKQNFYSIQLPKQTKPQYSSLLAKAKSIPQIPLSFEQLSKHYWQTKRS